MKRIFFLTAFLVPAVMLAQNIGVGTSTPTEKLDVSGNINVTGTIKANGTAGANGQVLSANASGNLVWADISEYKNHVNFSVTGTWTVPAGVTKIFVEAWGGGGGGSGFGGGGGGGYIGAWFTVAPGNSIPYVVGLGGFGGNNGSIVAESGTASSVTIGSVTVTANGGFGSIIYNTTPPVGVFGGDGGGYEATPVSFTNYIGQGGEDGAPNKLEYFQSTATTFLEATLGGKGGDGGCSPHSGCAGGYMLANAGTATLLRYVSGGAAKTPGGGGGGNYAGSGYAGVSGADGKVIIHY